MILELPGRTKIAPTVAPLRSRMRASFGIPDSPFTGVLAALLCALVSASAAEPLGNLKPESLTVAISEASFVSVNRNEGEASYRRLAELIRFKPDYLETMRTLRAAHRSAPVASPPNRHTGNANPSASPNDHRP